VYKSVSDGKRISTPNTSTVEAKRAKYRRDTMLKYAVGERCERENV